MKGLELSRLYYEQFGKHMIEENFPEYKERIAVGLAGHGSECFGFDDEISKDHDFAPGFCIWIDEDVDREIGFKLFRAYSKLPKEFLGIKLNESSLFGNDNKGVNTISSFYGNYIGGDLPRDNYEWLRIPDFYIAEATNGEVFCDPCGKFTAIRNYLKYECPEDVWLKKLASAVFNMAQAGQYNYSRCLKHGEKAAAAIALAEFSRNACHGVYILNRRYMPYYKWAYRGVLELGKLSELSGSFEELMADPYDEAKTTDIIESICAKIAEEIRAQGLSDRTESYLEPYAYCIRNKIQDGALRNSPVML